MPKANPKKHAGANSLRRTWMGALATCAAVLAVAGCDSRGASAHGGKAPAEKSSPEQPPGVGSRPVEIVEQDSGFRTVRHACGASHVPRNAKRVCALGFADELLSVGVRPIAAAAFGGRFPDYLEDRLQDVMPVPRQFGRFQPSFDAILESSPDLIVTDNPDPQTYRQLSKIAPTVVLTDRRKHGLQRLLDVGSIVGRNREARARAAWYRAKLDAARHILLDKLGDEKVAFFRVFGKQYYLHGRERAGVVLYDELGLTPPSQIGERGRGVMLSPETLLDLDAQYVFLVPEHTKGTALSVHRLPEHPAWKMIPAVRNGHVWELKTHSQWLVAGVLGKARIIDEVLRAVTPESVEAVNARADAFLAGGRD